MEADSKELVGGQAGVVLRRATVEDLEGLRRVWQELGYGGLGLEKCFQEFQVAVCPSSGLLGCMGLKIAQRDGWIHHGGVLKGFESVETELWSRLSKVIENNGLVRVWVEGEAWVKRGFMEPTPDQLQKKPASFEFSKGIRVLALRESSEEVILSLDKELELFRAAQEVSIRETLRAARVFKWVAYAILTGLVGVGLFFFLRFLFTAPPPSSLPVP